MICRDVAYVKSQQVLTHSSAMYEMTSELSNT